MVLLLHHPPLRVVSSSRRSLFAVASMAILEGRLSLVQSRPYANQPTHQFPHYEAVVVGAGPAGIAVVGNLLEQKKTPILWIDHEHDGGRLNKFYRQVPSNTKVKRFVGYAEGVQSFMDMAKETPAPNAYTHLKEMDQEKTCEIAQAADLCLMLSKGLDESKGVYKETGSVQNIKLTTIPIGKRAVWRVGIIRHLDRYRTSNLAEGKDSEHHRFDTNMVVYCTGSEPTLPTESSLPNQMCTILNLDTGLHPGKLASFMQHRKSPHSIAIIGASHSAILVLRNLYHLARDRLGTNGEEIQPFKIKWFTRHPLRYAEERDGWIFRDNTGLKGEVADWARDNLEDLAASPVSEYVEKISTSRETEKEDYEKHLKDCDYAVHAIGFTPRKANITKSKKKVAEPTYDDTTGQFIDQDGERLSGVYGAGIAFPEKVIDPEGNVEHAVGLFKFMNYLKKVVPTWTPVQ